MLNDFEKIKSALIDLATGSFLDQVFSYVMLKPITSLAIIILLIPIYFACNFLIGIINALREKGFFRPGDILRGERVERKYKPIPSILSFVILITSIVVIFSFVFSIILDNTKKGVISEYKEVVFEKMDYVSIDISSYTGMEEVPIDTKSDSDSHFYDVRFSLSNESLDENEANHLKGQEYVENEEDYTRFESTEVPTDDLGDPGSTPLNRVIEIELVDESNTSRDTYKYKELDEELMNLFDEERYVKEVISLTEKDLKEILSSGWKIVENKGE